MDNPITKQYGVIVTPHDDYTHEFRTLDGPRCTERQLGILIGAAHRAWENWNSLAEVKIQGVSPELDNAMRYLYSTTHESEIFLSGKVK